MDLTTTTVNDLLHSLDENDFNPSPSPSPASTSDDHHFHALQQQDLLEEVLSRLPLQPSITASAVCKLWQSVLSPPRTLCRTLSSRIFCNRPWFFFVGLNHFLAAKNQAFGFDPESWRWYRFPSFSLPPYDQGSLTGTHGLLYALAGSGICKLGFTTSLFRNSWRETPPLRFSRRSPIVEMIRKSEKRSHSLKTNVGFLLVVAGGKAMYDQLVVEIYDSEQDSWQICAPLPHQFRLSSTSQWMRSTVYQGKLIVYETDTGLMAYLDIDTHHHHHQWSTVFILKPQDSFCVYLVSCSPGLFIVGICRNPARIDLWLVDFASLQVTFFAQMPHDLYSLFNEDDDDEKSPLILCVGGGDFIYFYSDSWHKDYVACVCDLSGSKVCWRKIPHLPAPVNRFDRVVCFSSSVTEDTCLQ